MYLNLDNKEKHLIAAVDSCGNQITYGELCNFAKIFREIVEPRTIVFCLCENTVGALVGYTSFIENRVVPLLLPFNIESSLLKELMEIYKPRYFWYPSHFKVALAGDIIAEYFDYKLAVTENQPYPIYEELSLLLTTSGSTGSPKLVRHSYKNIEANARNVASVFNITTGDRAMADLPFQYTMGLNVICSHLYGGATVLLTPLSLMSKGYWDFFKAQRATTFTGVPYSYEVLRKLRFTSSEWPDLKILTQGGGKLPESTYIEFSKYAMSTGKAFIPTFGQTECTARMAYLPPELAIEKCTSIGGPIPEGELFLVDEQGNEITNQEAEGEMGYRGPNVTMGYAICREDLTKGDEWHGEILTGDIARRDRDGCYYIIGRRNRFLKLYGLRVSLDQCERLIQSEFNIECACTGTDRKMIIYITNEEYINAIPDFLTQKTNIYKSSFEARLIGEIPRNDTGKILYAQLDSV